MARSARAGAVRTDPGGRQGLRAAVLTAAAAADGNRAPRPDAAASVDEPAATEAAGGRPSADGPPVPETDAAAVADAARRPVRRPAARHLEQACSGFRLRPEAAAAPADARASAAAGRRAEPDPSWDLPRAVEGSAARHVPWGRPPRAGRLPAGKKPEPRDAVPREPGAQATGPPAPLQQVRPVRWLLPAVPAKAPRVRVSPPARVRRRQSEPLRSRPVRARRGRLAPLAPGTSVAPARE